jgi:hypothetical protein
MPVERTNPARLSVDLTRDTGNRLHEAGSRRPPLKSGSEQADVPPMSTQPRDLAWTQSSEPLQVDADGVTDYSFFSDEQLAEERDRQQTQLDELGTHSGESAAVRELRSSIDGEVKRMTDELRRRARSRHPSSRSLSDRFRPLRSLSWPPHTE